MALTEFQRIVCRLIAQHRMESGESYVAGGAALNALLPSPRISDDVDLFHDTEEALLATWRADRRLLESNGFEVVVGREFASFIEAEVRKGGQQTTLQWVRDSAYRFFPLVTHEDFGLVLHPFDLATNKVLALVGRLEVRDWVDLVLGAERIQPLGLLVWAACGKDPGLSPRAILEYSWRSSRHTDEEISRLQFEGTPPRAAELSRRWRALKEDADRVVGALPAAEVGKAVLDENGQLFRGDLSRLGEGLARKQIYFHTGCLRGALPRIIPAP